MKLTQWFLGLAAVAFSICGFAADAGSAKGERQYYELRVYSTQNEEQRAMIDNYWQKAAIPAYNRAGIQPIGVFTENQESPTNKVYVLIPFDSLSSLEGLPAKLAADATYQSESADFMNRTKNNAPYARMDISLLHAMVGMPRLALPPSTAEKKPWIFELRTYFSPTEGKGLNKLAMFNAGEIPVMKEVALNPVFFSGTVIGPQMPSLVYMVSGEDMDSHKEHWKGFGSNAVWKKLSGDPQYKDNVSGIKNVFLKRMAASQI